MQFAQFGIRTYATKVTKLNLCNQLPPESIRMHHIVLRQLTTLPRLPSQMGRGYHSPYPPLLVCPQLIFRFPRACVAVILRRNSYNSDLGARKWMGIVCVLRVRCLVFVNLPKLHVRRVGKTSIIDQHLTAVNMRLLIGLRERLIPKQKLRGKRSLQ